MLWPTSYSSPESKSSEWALGLRCCARKGEGATDYRAPCLLPLTAGPSVAMALQTQGVPDGRQDTRTSCEASSHCRLSPDHCKHPETLVSSLSQRSSSPGSPLAAETESMQCTWFCTSFSHRCQQGPGLLHSKIQKTGPRCYYAPHLQQGAVVPPTDQGQGLETL